MQGRNKGLTVFQIALTIVGGFILGIFAMIFSSSLKGILSAEAGETIATALILLPFQIICTCFCVLIGIIATIIAIKQRYKDKIKDGFSLAMLIVGIVYTVLPIIMDILTFVLANNIK